MGMRRESLAEIASGPPITVWSIKVIPTLCWIYIRKVYANSIPTKTINIRQLNKDVFEVE